MKIKLIQNCIVKFERNAVLEVSENEASRLISIGNAEKHIDPEEEKSEKKGKNNAKKIKAGAKD